MFASGGTVHNPSSTWKVFLLLRFPKIINIKPYLSTNKYLAKMGVHFDYALHSNALENLVYFVPTFFVD